MCTHAPTHVHIDTSMHVHTHVCIHTHHTHSLHTQPLGDVWPVQRVTHCVQPGPPLEVRAVLGAGPGPWLENIA